jgi:hypothetical protein
MRGKNNCSGFTMKGGISSKERSKMQVYEGRGNKKNKNDEEKERKKESI